jgi:RHS repeat-associated protein
MGAPSPVRSADSTASPFAPFCLARLLGLSGFELSPFLRPLRLIQKKAKKASSSRVLANPAECTMRGLLSLVHYYDESGNMTKDRNKGLDEVIYNHLNKPTEVSRSANETITYIYSADGTKLRQKMDDNGTTKITDYVNGFHYEDDGTTSGLQFFSHEEGRVVAIDDTTFEFEYTISDHLGNGRVYFKEDPNTIGVPIEIQETHYYAFGLEISDLGYQSGSLNAFQYNGKELQDELDLNWYDYGARMYDATIGRWNGVDALAVKYLIWSPYNYVAGNPLKFIDPNGKDIKPSKAFLNSPYSNTYSKLMATNSVYQKLTKVFTNPPLNSLKRDYCYQQ